MKSGTATIRGGAIAAIVLVVLGAASATPWVVTLRLPTFGPVEPPALDIPPVTLAPQEPAEPDLAIAETLEKILVVGLAVIAAALVGFALFRLVQRLRAAWRPEDVPVETDQLDAGEALGEVAEVDIAALATAVARAEAHLAGIAEPADAVTAAWVALEDEAALQGTVRDPAQTTTEFATELLRHTPAPAGAVAVLRGLYHRARFTSHPVTPADVQRTREALARIATALDAASVDSPPGGTSAVELTIRGLVVRVGVVAAISAALGLGGVLDPTHAALLGCLLVATVLLRSGRPDPVGPGWPTRRFTTRAGGRNGVSDLAWQVFDTDRRVRLHVVQRVRELAGARLAFLGVDVDDPSQRPEVERLLGPQVAAGLFTDRRPTARTLQTWLDALDRLNHERTNHDGSHLGGQ